jgi:tetratricopeptide (TPR) repeat protein
LAAFLSVQMGAFVVAPPRAAQAEDQAEGRRRFKRGQELYAEGRFLDAAREFEAGYAVAPRPLFLLNIGQSYRRGNEFEKAKRAYEMLLRVDPQTPHRAEVEEHIRAIDDALAAAAVLPAPPPAGGTQAARPAARPAPPPSAPPPEPRATAPVVMDRPEPTEASDGDESVFKKAWFWAVVAGVAAAGVTAVVLSTRSRSSCPGDLCIRETP